MKKYFLYSLFVFLSGCYPTTKVTGTWKNPNSSKSYHSVFVAALTGNTLAKSSIEKEISAALENRGVVTVRSMDEMPPTFKNDSTSRDAILAMVKSMKSEAILTVSVLKKETESRYVSGGYAPLSRWDYYGSFGGYYNYWYPNAYNPGYYQQDDIYYLESNLYDGSTEALIWSAQSRTYSFDGIAGLAREFSIIIVEKMYEEGVLK